MAKLKILYGIQGTGNGHITRANEVIPYLQKHGDLDILISGKHSELKLKAEVNYKLKGLGFIFGKKGGIDYWKTFLNSDISALLSEIKQIPVEKYDLIISDFEPVTAWGALKKGKNCVGLSNQCATLHPLAPKPKNFDIIGKLVMEKYAPCKVNYGLHYKALDKNIFTPIIPEKIRNAEIKNKGHYTVYLPSYSDKKIISVLSKIDADWHVFSKHTDKPFKEKNVRIVPVHSRLFFESITTSSGVITNSGFGTTSEALFMNKKLLVIPMKGQIEQLYNAEMLKKMGVVKMKKLSSRKLENIEEWLNQKNYVSVKFENYTKTIVEKIIDENT